MPELHRDGRLKTSFNVFTEIKKEGRVVVISDTALVTLHPSDRLSLIYKVSRQLALTKIGNRYLRNDLPPSWSTWTLQTEFIPAN
jgi:hypothetical protein